jgi:hypothetical protein
MTEWNRENAKMSFMPVSRMKDGLPNLVQHCGAIEQYSAQFQSQERGTVAKYSGLIPKLLLTNNLKHRSTLPTLFLFGKVAKKSEARLYANCPRS